MTETEGKVPCALISVSDKTGIAEFCRELVSFGVEILSTGGTARTLRENDIPVVEVSDYTGFPEMMNGRVKTLHPKIHGGILGRRGVDEQTMAAHGIKSIDLVVVNLYPFEETVASPGCDRETAIENIDIGGPAMLRAAAKNHAAVGVIVDPGDYPAVLNELSNTGGVLSDQTRYRLAVKSFNHTANYDRAVANYLGEQESVDFPNPLILHYQRAQVLRYGENPHQKAALYLEPGATDGAIASARQLQGKPLSYNNIADADTALGCVKSFHGQACCVIVKHANPCGVAHADSLLDAYAHAYRTDPTSAFGGIIAFNGELDADATKAIIDQQFVEVLIAPSVSTGAADILATKQNIRVLATGAWTGSATTGWEYKSINQGLLIQQCDDGEVNRGDIEVVTKRRPDPSEIDDLLFAWKTAKWVKSNAIVYCKNLQTIGIGAGQMSRVYSARIAALKATDEGLEVTGSVMASDAFFPFRDSIDSAAQAGITAVIQPGGSLRDNEVIAAADEHNMAMVFTGMRHFRH